jgi:hypothetical protein
MGRPKTGTSAAAGRAVQTGMRRISWVRITLDEQGIHCDLLGVGHRRPMVRQISLDTALTLASRGVPTVVRSPEGTTQPLLATG